MGYTKEFGHLIYDIPEFLLEDKNWEDVSWHNDICPRFENKTRLLAIWVETINPELREYDDWKQYTVVKLIPYSDGKLQLADDTLFTTEDAMKLECWLWLYTTKCNLEHASLALCRMDEPLEELQDNIATLLAQTDEAMASLEDQT